MLGTTRPAGEVRVERTQVDGVELRAWTYASAAPDAPDVVLVHGLGTSGATFGPLVGRLVTERTVHVLELPGFAGLARPEDSLTVPQLAAVVTAWVRRAGLDRPTLVGHSMGTQVVAEAAAATPGLASDVVLVGPTADAEARDTLRMMVRLARSAVHESVGANTLVVRSYLACGPRWYLAELRHMLDHPIERRLPDVTVPVLVVRGERDRVAPARWADRLATTAARGRTVTVPGAGHLAMHSHPGEVADLVLGHVVR